MKAIEFVSNKVDGMIQVPEQFKDLLTGEFRVIILVDEPTHLKKIVAEKKQFKAIEITTKDLKFDRDEANER